VFSAFGTLFIEMNVDFHVARMRVSMWWVTAVSYDRTTTLLACRVLVEVEMHVIESVVDNQLE
jgi:hypothetical protein